MRLIDNIQYAFNGGEISPKYFGRSDVDNYRLSLALSQNFFVDPEGGLSNCPGTQFIDYIMEPDRESKFLPFKFAPSLPATYTLLFGHNYLRFIQDGAYVLEPELAITSFTIDPNPVFTRVAHGLSNGDWVKIYAAPDEANLNDRTWVVTGATANTFQLESPLGVAADSSAVLIGVPTASAYRVYTVVTPYEGEDLEFLRSHQSRSQVVLTHPNHKPQVLIRVNDTNWTLNEIAFGNDLVTPTGLTITPSSAGTAGVGVVVTSVDKDGNESLPGQYVFNTLCVDMTNVAGASYKYTWTAVAGAAYYRVYRTQVLPIGTEITRSQPVGYLGLAYGPEFVDNNVVPNFAGTPPLHTDPFANGAIEYIQVTAPGTGYSLTSTVSATVGTGFIGQAIVNNAGELLGILVIKGGKDYTGATTISVSGGSGATVTVDLQEATGNNPLVATVFQQRQVFASSLNDPLTIWGSRPTKFTNFDVSVVPIASDSYSFTLDSEEVAPVLHLIPARQGLVMFTQAGIFQLSSADGIVRATDALVDPQTYVGCSLLPPIRMDSDLIYVEDKGQRYRMMTYSEYQKLYLAQNLSVLAGHLIPPSLPLLAWTYAAEPFKLLYGVRSDGLMVLTTLDKEQQLVAWARRTTKGLFQDVISTREGEEDAVYVAVRRYLNGQWVKLLERIASRVFSHTEDGWFLDCALSHIIVRPTATLTASAVTGTGVTFTLSDVTGGAAFTADDIGSVIRIGGGAAEVTGWTSSTVVTGTIIRDITTVLSETSGTQIPLPAASGEWSIDPKVTEVSGLDHLNGETVSILADGAVLPDAVVTAGKITLHVAASRILVGLPYRAIAKTLPHVANDEIIDAKRKRMVKTAVREHESRGLKVGTDLTNLIEFKERLAEDYDEATMAQTGVVVQVLRDTYNLDSSTFYVQDYPLPVTILGLVNRLEVGD